MVVDEQTPKLFDYFAGAILTNAIGILAIYLASYEQFFQYMLIPIWCLAAIISTYLVCMRTSREHLVTGVKTAIVSIALGVIMIPNLKELELGSLILIFVCFLVGSIIGAYYALKEHLRMKKHTMIPPLTAKS